jgi:hypothetical protein
MGQQMTEGHLRRSRWRLDPQSLQIVVHRIVELAQPLVAQLHQTDRRQRLRDRRDAKHRVRAYRTAAWPIREPKAFDRGLITPRHHRDRNASHAVASAGVDHQ